ncbi:AraC family transcriptional regulator [Hathewaya proteolytica DSM 3090]|uniref:AraC family transcriptional regulator n=1 Tax=Hathewaya proteolytica DSM 3090 TaxID=1121331 RepID=A0A1M6PFS5_9CLOT|nr:helix-turn-helix domain-containing protein [Hathewaya proteolytica]SHK06752.1 AraC family transcriptional regulator [Hathewaya proteolytica DSM 3090]
MKNFYVLTDALNYIENNLCDIINQEELAKACYCSLSSLQKIFKYVFQLSINDYICRRRMTCAAKELIESDMSITDISFRYQYSSPEIFTRAFTRVWKMTPSEFRRERRFTGLFPKYDFKYDGGENIMSSKKFDISMLYDEIKKRSNTYVLCFDICGMMELNKISRDVGDKAILQCLERIDNNASDDMFLFRSGGDEFVLVTGLENLEQLEKLAEKIMDLNGQTIESQGESIPVFMRVGGMKIGEGNLKYCDVFTNIREVIEETRRSKEDVRIV